MVEEKSKKILYIEDDADTRSLMGDIIRYKGYVYYEADCGLKGISLAIKHKPDLILIDLILPDFQGYEVTTHLKHIEELKNTPIIALTGEVQGDIRELTLTAGCDGYIKKPINITEFLFKIDEYLSGKREVLDPDQEKVFLQRYNVHLVEKLRNKIIELEQMNENLSRLNRELYESREEFAKYNDWLFYMNSLANTLRTQSDPFQMLKILPAKMCEGFKIDRCILFTLDPDKKSVTPYASAGIGEKSGLKKQYTISSDVLSLIRKENGMLWVKGPKDVTDKSLRKLATSLEADTYLVGILSHFSPSSDSTQILRRISRDVKEQHTLSNLPKRFFIFIDQKDPNARFETYEIRILKAFIQTVSIIFENMVLYYDLVKLYKMKEQQASTDGLTALYNYRYFITEIEREIKRCERFETHFSLLMIDIDHFKEYNDKMGHLRGDEVLQTLSSLMQNNTRSIDSVCRYGGEEFTIILPGLEKKNALVLANKLRELIEDHRFPLEKKLSTKTVSVSIGVADYPANGKTAKEIIESADKALYAAKRNGRNRVEEA